MSWITRDVDQVWHEWFNQQKPHDHTLYEFKTMMHELQRLPIWFKKQREGKLPKIHRQCSQSAPEPIKDNKLICALGVKVPDCSILKSLEEYFSKRRESYTGITEDDMDKVKAATCCWHIFKESTVEGKHLDTSDGYIQDESDRMYWNNVCESLSKSDDQHQKT